MSDSTIPAKFTKLRTTIIVVSMIVMPLCAIVGVKMPKFLNDLTTDSVGMSHADNKGKPTAQATGTASRERTKSKPLERAVSLAEAESGRAAPSDRSMMDRAMPDRAAPQAGGLPADSAYPSSSYAQLASQSGQGPNSDVRRAGGFGVSQALALESPAGSAPPVGFDTTGSIQALPPLDEAARVAAPPSGGATAGDQFSQIQSRLKALGATHYTLETWGAGGNSYRFQCRMAAGHSADYTRQFEATDTDPLRTMQTVLDEVEAWKAGRLP